MSKERDSKKRVAFVQLFAEASSSTAVPSEIHVVPTGKWDHPMYGEMEITPADISEFVQNYSRGVRLDIPITAGHDDGMSGGELPAIGWFTELSDRGSSGLYAAVILALPSGKSCKSCASQSSALAIVGASSAPTLNEMMNAPLIWSCLPSSVHLRTPFSRRADLCHADGDGERGVAYRAPAGEYSAHAGELFAAAAGGG